MAKSPRFWLLLAGEETTRHSPRVARFRSAPGTGLSLGRTPRQGQECPGTAPGNRGEGVWEAAGSRTDPKKVSGGRVTG